MSKITKDDFYERREMKKGKKRHWGFTCPICNEKFSSKTYSEYYICEEHLTGPLDKIYIFCSKDCVFDFLKTINVDIETIIKEHNESMDRLDELEKQG